MLYRFLAATVFLGCCLSTLHGQLLVEENGSVGVSVDTIADTQFWLNNPYRTYGLYLNQGRTDQNETTFGLYNDMDRGSGERTGYYGNVHTLAGQATGIYNRVATNGPEPANGIINRIGGGIGLRRGMYTYLRDDGNEQSPSTEPMIGTHTYIYRHYHRPQVYGSKIEVRSYDDDPSHSAYGQYVNFIKSSDAGAVSYGVYSRVPKDKDYAGYFIGNVSVNGALVLTSDKRVKQNSAAIKGPLDAIMRLKPQQYNFRQDTRFSYDGDRLHYGFAAQEVEEVLPAVVHDIHHPPVMEPIEDVDEEKPTTVKDRIDGIPGTPKGLALGKQKYRTVHPAETLKGVNYTDLIAVLTGAIQEQQEMIKELSDELATVKVDLKAFRDCTQCSGSADSPKIDLRTPGGQGSTPTDNILGSDRASIYPNPATGFVTINHPTSDNYQIRILSVEGGEVLRVSASTYAATIQTSALVPGSYVVEITPQGGAADRQTLVIQ